MKAPLRLLAAALSVAAATSVAHADDYPSKPVRVIVPVTAGGGVDTAARLIATHLRNELGQTFVVENKPGAGGNIGLDLLAKAPADGYTLAVIPNTMTINHTLMSKLPFDTLKSFAPVALLGTTPAVLGARGNLAPKSLKELVDYAKQNPGKLSYAGCDTGSALHLAGEMFKQQASVDVTHVPYKGCSDSVPNVLGGQVDLIFITFTNIAGYVKDGRMRVYAVAADQRTPYAPDLPTGAEQGYPGFNIDIWYGMLAPAGTPADIVNKLNKAVNVVLKKPDVQASFATSYVTPVGGTPEQFGAKIRSDVERYGAVIKKANIRVE
ncbi:Tripartite tricarboxylate transporter family receptor [Pigmentiphaga humi]|uniref:Tripartite tricarboxylate transporter family receptor n=1 Tax=Pigmentiphaga humi TaxID=2478468 RepID=A0A3P4AZN6_9BURK|nr:tripartite tricarboxylate transporter substrate binding protein [Pigmentiphaga humi]VCU68305.1 Tripartite tricarboxylate transporter family receptor [Pigmentiphaga humi]